MLKLISGILEEIGKGQKTNMGLVYLLVLINQDKGGDFRIDENGVIRFKHRVCVVDVPELKKSILKEGHKNGLSIHLGATNMYRDLKKLFWCPGMKREVVEFVYAYLTCQKLKVEHHRLLGMIQPLSILEWKWDNIFMDFMTSLLKTMKGCDYILVIIDG